MWAFRAGFRMVFGDQIHFHALGAHTSATHTTDISRQPCFFRFFPLIGPLKMWFTWNLWYCRLRKDSPRPRSGLSLHDHDRPLSRVSEGQGVREQARRASEAGALSPLHPTLHCVSLKFAFSGALLAVMTSCRAFAELSPNDVLRGAGARAVQQGTKSKWAANDRPCAELWDGQLLRASHPVRRQCSGESKRTIGRPKVNELIH